MKKEKVTYGVYHMNEWYAEIKIGAGKKLIPFTGGATEKNGVTPATYTTSNPIVQLAIEASSYFKNGRISRVASYPLEGELKIMRNDSSVQDEERGVHNDCAGGEVKAEAEGMAAEEIKVGALADARLILQERYGYEAGKVRTTAQIEAAAAEHGIKFLFDE